MSKYLKGHTWSSVHVQWCPVRNLQSQKTEPYSKGLGSNVRGNIRQKIHCLHNSDPFSHNSNNMSLHKKTSAHDSHNAVKNFRALWENTTNNDVAMTPTVFSKRSQVRASITTFYPVTACNHCTAGQHQLSNHLQDLINYTLFLCKWMSST